jgi:hypothetical protein
MEHTEVKVIGCQGEMEEGSRDGWRVGGRWRRMESRREVEKDGESEGSREGWRVGGK